jgi:alpha,alpha-trehalase
MTANQRIIKSSNQRINYKQNSYSFFLAVVLLVFSCQKQNPEAVDFYSTELFQRVQREAIFVDSKTFPDCIPKTPLSEILKVYDQQKNTTSFSLKNFVTRHFSIPQQQSGDAINTQHKSLTKHIDSLWLVLTRKPDATIPGSSLLPLPNSYIVPGGRFREIYYWDSYFTMLGLTVTHNEMIQNMINNFAFLIDSVGFIPNGNRTYYLSRSQPPFFSLMVKVWQSVDSLAPLHYLNQMEKEYSFWMNGAEKLTLPGEAIHHVVVMPDGTYMNRYFDSSPSPRPESYREDYELAKYSTREPAQLYRDLRSAAESGWDFSSRWLTNDTLLHTIQTTSLIPVDLNCLLWHLEKMLAEAYHLKGDKEKSRAFLNKAGSRRKSLLTFCYDTDKQFFYDYNFQSQQLSLHKTLAGAWPLFFTLVSPDIAEHISRTLEQEFLKPGGLVTTLAESHQQWDWPNGWAPLQWMVYKGLKIYKKDTLACEVKKRWLLLNEKVFYRTGKMLEKYNVVDTTSVSGGGEYPTQDGFGWTNGVYLALKYDSVGKE